MNRAETVETIVAQLDGMEMEANELTSFMMLYIMDPAFDRGGICEAEKIIKRARGW